jgi:hypothetical protein
MAAEGQLSVIVRECRAQSAERREAKSLSEPRKTAAKKPRIVR